MTAPAGQERVPRLFLAVVVLAVLYVGLRIVQMVGWFLNWLL